MDVHLSVSTWPGCRVPVPELARCPEATLDGEMIRLGLRREMAPTPPELYLRHARQIDPGDPAALLDFVRTVGGVPTEHVPDRDLWENGTEARAWFAAGRGRRYERPSFRGRREGFVAVHLDEVAYRLHILDVLGQHAVAYLNGDHLAPVWRDAPAPIMGPAPGESAEWIRTDTDAWQVFLSHASKALQLSHQRVIVLHLGRDLDPRRATFLEAGVSQIVNDLADEVDYLTCPNCGLIFARQVGGSTHYSRRTGVTYCSPSCATSARVKAYRARKRAEGK
jgi:hypothetical protein